MEGDSSAEAEALWLDESTEQQASKARALGGGCQPTGEAKVTGGEPSDGVKEPMLGVDPAELAMPLIGTILREAAASGDKPI